MSKTAADQKEKTADEVRWNVLQKKAQEMQALRAFRLFEENGIQPILIKGWAVARSYPDSVPRASVDMDLAVAGGDFENAKAISVSPLAKGLAIDLHRELRHLDTVEWHDLFAHSQLITLGDSRIRVLCPEDHLRVLCTHWLTDGGSYKDRLWDIYYLVQNRAPDFDWDRCLNSTNAVRRGWVVCTMGLAHRYLGLGLESTPVRDEAVDVPKWLIRELEREWASEVRLLPLHIAMQDRGRLAGQVRKRLRPNPIQATIEMGGDLYAATRLHYQTGSFIKRIFPSVRRVFNAIKQKTK